MEYNPFRYRAYDPCPIDSYLSCAVGTESFTDTIAYIKDVVGHAFRTVKLNITHFNKDYIQSDFQQYYSEHKSRISVYLNNPVRTIKKDLFVPMPDGMIGRYPEVTQLLSSFISLPFGEIIKTLLYTTDALTRLIRKDMDGSSRNDLLISKIEAAHLTDTIETTHDFGERLPKYFRKGKATASTADKQFSSKAEVANVVDQLLLCGNRLKEFLKHQQDIRKVEESFRKLSDAAISLESKLSGSVKTEFTKTIHDYIKDIALFFDYYGIALNEILRIENKFTMVLSTLMAA